MIVALLCGLGLLSYLSAFHHDVKVTGRRTFTMTLAKDPDSLAADFKTGIVAPTGFFDPFGLSSGKSEQVLKKWQESELKHGRVCMLAATAFIVQENWADKLNPLYGYKIMGPAINHFQQADAILPFFWLWLIIATGAIEAYTIQKAWEPNTFGKRVANLRDDYIVGDLGFDPLNLMPKDEDGFNRLRTRELQNGRLAMIGVAGMVAQELVNPSKLFLGANTPL